MVRHRRPPSRTWRTFLENHVKTLVSVDFFTVPTICFQILYVFLVLAHERHRIVHFNVTTHPTAEWTAQQLREAFPWDTAPRNFLHNVTHVGLTDPNFRDVLGAGYAGHPPIRIHEATITNQRLEAGPMTTAKAVSATSRPGVC